MKEIIWYLIYPGILFSVVAGMAAGWIDRKVTARVQWRVGPPWYQPLADILKLMGKETLIPRGASRTVFVGAPCAAFAAAGLVACILGIVNLFPDRGFVGDLIVIIYLLLIPPLALMFGGAASRNPLASLGVSREMKLIIAYELPFLLIVLTAVIKAGMTIDMGAIVSCQQAHGAFLWEWSAVFAFVAGLLCMQAKLGMCPFDIAEAETEINAGPLIEYSGPLLALFKMTKMVLLYALPVLLLTLFAGGVAFSGWGIFFSIVKYALLLLFITVIRNTNPRLRIDQAMKFFWGPVTLLAAAGVVLALLGY